MIAAVVPAAGKSTRMGRPKLTLPVAGGGTVIERVVSALRLGGVDSIVVVGPPPEEPGAAELFERATFAAASAIPVPRPTADMRATVEVGLEFLDRARINPVAVLIAPGDCVGLTPQVVSMVIDRVKSDPRSIVIPVYGGRRGHPIALPRDVAGAIRGLPEGVGINAIREHFADRVVLIEVPDPGVAEDLDTPGDYSRWSPEPE
ncbi:nucleotidyltransferase family protein [Tautonia plasticadhaerens]|uniref:Molybdopterin-guanine dinucleotide biosynthesis protein A n=1 Tax=Tautonia plasticadhaerens TaxID=2527974 RepID=A0A518H012_9BACT|nr:nucleotidyltransferase family protein [Tautonia plasticadhaerens]QDV34173.1 molybdopterin-guanine dinucleotide biosynthesis protein A [Tautonia plasticadhaerens]